MALTLGWAATADRAVAQDVKVGGSLRERVEIQDNPRLGRGGSEDQTVLLHRLLVHADWQIDPVFRAFVEVGNHAVTGDKGFRPPVYRNDLDLQQAFLDVAVADEWRARIGRQEVALASGRIIAVRDQPNIRRAFDGVRLTGVIGEVGFDAFGLRPVENRERAFDDRTDPNESLIGASIGRMLNDRWGRLEITYLRSTNQLARFADGSGEERRDSFGLRAVKAAGVVWWDWEAWVQTGRVDSQEIRAWTIATDTSFGEEDWPAGMRLGLKANIASGDTYRGDGRIGTFNALYPRLNYFSEAAAIAPANIMDLHPWIEIHPAHNIRLNIEWDSLWRHRRSDAVYLAPFVVTPVSDDDRFIAHQANVVGTWSPRESLEFSTSWTRFWPGASLRDTGAKTQNLVVLQGKVAF